MSKKIEINVELRQQLGTTRMRRMRREQDCVPAVIYGGGETSKTITVSHKDMSLALENEGIYSRVLKLRLDGKQEQVVLKNVQRHPYKPRLLHIDFQRVKASEKLNVVVPIHLLNEEEAKGVEAGGIVSRLLTEIEVQCLPGDLPEALTVDILNLDVGESLHVADITLPAGVSWVGEMTEKVHQPIVSIHLPKAPEPEVTEVAEEEVTEQAEGETSAASESSESAAEGEE